MFTVNEKKKIALFPAFFSARLTTAQAAQTTALKLKPFEIKVMGTLSSDDSSHLLNNVLLSAFSSAAGISIQFSLSYSISYSKMCLSVLYRNPGPDPQQSGEEKLHLNRKKPWAGCCLYGGPDY